uniref:Charged multivesicular body protein 4b n=1 Tax=Steinernema glaseri TaxID=37863 RepID=A0A1I7YFR1_9BILA
MMGFFARIFGRQEPPAESSEDAINKLKETEELLMKKQEFLERKIEKELAQAKKHGTENKRAALQALKRKKHFESQLNQLDNQILTIETQRQTLENASTNAEILKIMGLAAKSLKKAHKEMDVDEVHDLMEDIAEQQEVANEVAEAISSPGRFGSDVDEDDLMKELEEMEQEEVDKQLLKVPTYDENTLPKVPEGELADLEKELKELAVF